MDFSDSRKRQRTYRDEETGSVESKQRVLNEIDKVCAAVNVKILTTNERQCIYKVADYVKGGSLRPISKPCASFDHRRLEPGWITPN